VGGRDDLDVRLAGDRAGAAACGRADAGRRAARDGPADGGRRGAVPGCGAAGRRLDRPAAGAAAADGAGRPRPGDAAGVDSARLRVRRIDDGAALHRGGDERLADGAVQHGLHHSAAAVGTRASARRRQRPRPNQRRRCAGRRSGGGRAARAGALGAGRDPARRRLVSAQRGRDWEHDTGQRWQATGRRSAAAAGRGGRGPAVRGRRSRAAGDRRQRGHAEPVRDADPVDPDPLRPPRVAPRCRRHWPDLRRRRSRRADWGDIRPSDRAHAGIGPLDLCRHRLVQRSSACDPDRIRAVRRSDPGGQRAAGRGGRDGVRRQRNDARPADDAGRATRSDGRHDELRDPGGEAAGRAAGRRPGRAAGTARCPVGGGRRRHADCAVDVVLAAAQRLAVVGQPALKRSSTTSGRASSRNGTSVVPVPRETTSVVSPTRCTPSR
jgi:hypothetical protein